MNVITDTVSRKKQPAKWPFPTGSDTPESPMFHRLLTGLERRKLIARVRVRVPEG